MPDWTKSMQQSYEYYTVEPTTLADIKRLDNVKSASFSRDTEAETLGSATIDVTNSVGESYIRGYLKTIQNGVTEKFPLGMVLSQTPSSSFNGKILDVSMDCYTPLIELKEKNPPLGYTVRKGTRIMDAAYRIVRENARVPVNKVEPIIDKSKNLFDNSIRELRTGYDIANATLISQTDTGVVLQGNEGEGTANCSYGWYRPGNYWTSKNNMYLAKDTTVTISADYTVLEFRYDTRTEEQNRIGIYLYSSSGKGSLALRKVTVDTANKKYRVTATYTTTNDYDTYYPVFTLNSNKVEIDNIQIELGSEATSYESYFEPIDLSPTLQQDFVANTDDTWLSFVIDLISNAKYELGLGERGDILFLPKQDIASLQPVWTYDDDNSSILYPELTMDHDLYGVPNVVEVIYSYGTDYKQAIAKNEDPNSPISTVNRGREIVHRVTDPSLAGYVTQDQIEDYAERLLKELSTIEYTVSYTHAYCPVRVGDCVRLNYTRAGIKNIKAKVISQNIKCEPGCPVSEKAVFTSKLWG